MGKKNWINRKTLLFVLFPLIHHIPSIAQNLAMGRLGVGMKKIEFDDVKWIQNTKNIYPKK